MKPGDDAILKVSSRPHSTVSLLAIDQRVLLLKTGNDLSLDEVFNDFDAYNLNNFGGGPIPFNDFALFRRPFIPWPHYETYQQKFEVKFILVINRF